MNDKSMPDVIWAWEGEKYPIRGWRETKPSKKCGQYTRTQAIVELLEGMAQDAPLMNYSEDDYNAGFVHGLEYAIRAIKDMG